jgi:NAD-dependent SIR2 family protein deacetylase
VLFRPDELNANLVGVIEVNPGPSELTALADVFLQGRAGHVLPRLVRMVAELKRVGG